MLEKLQKLYNTLETIETKGRSTRIMATCLSYLENIIAEERMADTVPKSGDLTNVPSESDPDQAAE